MQLSNQQQAQRALGIGSSDIAAIAGLSPYASPMDVWLSKTGRSSFTGNARTNWGHAMEPIIATQAAAQLGLGEPTAINETYRSRDHSVILATPDYVAGDCILEAKNVGLRVAGSWSDEPPAYVTAQITQQMYVTGLRNAYACASLAGDPPQCYRVEYDADFAVGLVDLGLEFWERYVVANMPPPLDHGEATAEYLRQQYPRNLGALKAADDAIESEIAEAKQLWLDIKRHECELTLRCHRVMEYIGASEGVTSNLGKVTWKTQKGRVQNSKVVASLAERLQCSKTDITALQDAHRGESPRVFLWPRIWGK